MSSTCPTAVSSTVTGPDRLGWLHSLTTQHLERLEPGRGVTALVLSPQGHIEHALYGVDDGETFWAHTEPGAAPALVAWLDRMRFLMRVEVADRSAEYAVVWTAGEPAGDLLARTGQDSLGGRELFVPRARSRAACWPTRRGPGCGRTRPAGSPPGCRGSGVDTDHRTIPNEAGLIGVAVHLDKGCYRGQETVARVHTLGRPPRRLVRLHLDGSVDALPEPGTALELDGRAVGFVGSSARHYELGPIALGLVKRNVPVDAELLVGGSPPARKPWSTPRSACTSAPSSDPARAAPAAFRRSLCMHRFRPLTTGCNLW